MILEIPQSTLDRWEQTATVLWSGNCSEEKITKWFEYCKKWELEDLNRPKIDDSSNSRGMTMDMMGGSDVKALMVFTHADGFKCLRILDSYYLQGLSDAEKLKVEQSKKL